MLDHLRVVVGSEKGFAPSAVGHGQPADKIREPDVGGAFLLRVLVQVVVQLPGLIPDPQVVGLVVHHVMEEHVVRDEDLVHATPGLETVQVMLGRLALDVARLVRQMHAGRVDAFAAGLEHFGDGVLGQPVDLEVGPQAAQLVGNRHIALGVAQPDRRRDVERTLAAPPATSPGQRGSR